MNLDTVNDSEILKLETRNNKSGDVCMF